MAELSAHIFTHVEPEIAKTAEGCVAKRTKRLERDILFDSTRCSQGSVIADNALDRKDGAKAAKIRDWPEYCHCL
jgi:hypothetical protein